MHDAPRISDPILRALGDAYAPAQMSGPQNVVLSLRISDRDISIRDLSAFLDLADRIYGRLYEDGLPSYAHRQESHVHIARMVRGSWELKLVELLGSAAGVGIIVVGLILKYLPGLAKAYSDIQEGRLARQRRIQITEQLREERELRSLNDNQWRGLVKLIDDLLTKDKALLPRASRFAKKDVLDVIMHAEDRKEKP